MTRQALTGYPYDMLDGETEDEYVDRMIALTEPVPERIVVSGRCTLCENDADELITWSQHERLCWDCVDLNLDLLAKAVQAEVPVTFQPRIGGRAELLPNIAMDLVPSR